MCGISAIIKTNHIDLDINWLVGMNDLIKHRGPDGEGYVFISSNSQVIAGGNDTSEEILRSELNYTPNNRSDKLDQVEDAIVALGHRRLAIVDLTPTGHQPMSYLKGRYWITYNGEVYNYLEIREELKTKGYPFISQSDTEVILAAYDCWGKDCLHRFNGMFAFVLIDIVANEIFIARDRFGVKPLYYWVSPEGFIAFASEIKQFTVLPGWVAKMKGQRVYDYLSRGLSDHTDETMFEGVYQLRGGEAIFENIKELQSLVKANLIGKLPKYLWYELKPKDFDDSYDQAVLHFKELLTDAVRIRLRADVPVGSCLSGGLDSSSIVCLANMIIKQNINQVRQKTFSACAKDKRFDEREYIDEVVKHTGVKSHYVYPDVVGMFNELSKITWHQDEPFGSSSIYAQWEVFKLAAGNDVKVMLDGQGGDEQLAGYSSFINPFLLGLLLSMKFSTLFSETKVMIKQNDQSILLAKF